MSVSTMLETVQTQIQTKTSELPSLYDQLGLPSTTLADELSSLQSRLIDCVDEVVNGRKKEVEEWLRKCRTVEEKIQALLRATGSSSANHVGFSDRLDPILPKRLETLSTYRETLSQLYTTKLEQRSALYIRISDLAHVLGNGFLPTCTDQDQDMITTTNEDRPLLDVTPECLSKLERDLVRAKLEITKRRTALAQTFDHLSWLHTELGLELPSPDPFSDGRTSASQPGNPHSAVSIFESFVISGTADSLVEVEPTTSLTEWASSRVTELETLKSNRELQIQTLYDQLEPLWKRLGVDDKDVDEFVESRRGSTESVIEAYEAELERMLELKRSMMSTFIANTRSDIGGMWTELMYSDAERGAFTPFFDDEHTEELLAQHEIELERLRSELKSKSRILAAVKKYKDICEEEKELAAAASDQSRLLGRGPRDPGRLLREEKMRKRVTKEKPRLEEDLLVSISQWEEVHGSAFRADGVRFLSILHENVNKSQGEKENKKRGRANTGPSRATTPGPPPSHPQHTHSTTKRSKAENGIAIPSSQHAIRNRSVTPTPINAYHVTSGRQILGSRNGVLNMATPTPVYNNNVARSKTPSNTLPRLKSGLPVPQLVPTPSLLGAGTVAGIPTHPSMDLYGKLGFGLPSTLSKGMDTSAFRTISGHSSVSTTSRVVSHTHQRRESFRPRSSVGDKTSLIRRGSEERARHFIEGGGGGLLLEEEEA